MCKHFGLSTKSFTYLALYEADSQQILENLEAIAKASKEVIEFISFIFRFNLYCKEQANLVLNK